MLLTHLDSGEEIIERLIKTFNKNIELKSEISNKIKTTHGSEKLSWIKKYNSLFIK